MNPGSSPCGHESAVYSGLSAQRGSPGQENHLLEHETRRLTEELHTRTMLNGFHFFHVRMYMQYIYMYIFCTDYYLQRFYQHTHRNMFFPNQYIYFTRIRCKWIWIASRLYSRLYSLSRLFSKSVFPCFRTGQMQF